MNYRNRVKAILLGGAALGCLAAPQTVLAQDEEEDDDYEVIIVTGSRIARAGFDTLQPASQVAADFIDARGFSNVADALRQIPTFGASAGTAGASPNGGQATQNLGQNFVNVFGMGSERTLTLINGRRAVGGNAPAAGNVNSGLQVDLNIIPTALIDRIETIYTGGAPIYGSDAIAATVNVILKDDYEGMELDGQFGLTEQGDAWSHRVRSVIGGNFASGRGNAVISAEYTRQEGLLATSRLDVTQGNTYCTTRINRDGFDGQAPADGQVDAVFCEDGVNVWQVPETGAPMPANNLLGHPNSRSDGAALNLDTTNDGVNDANSFLGASANNYFKDAQGRPWLFDLNGRDIITFDQANLGIPNQAFFSQGAGRNNPYVVNLNDTNTLIAPLERYIISGIAHYDLNDNIRAIMEVLYARSEAVDELNQPQWSNAAFARNSNLIIKVNNPYLSQQARDLISAQIGAAPTVDTNFDGVVNSSDERVFYLTRTNNDLFAGSPNTRSQDTFRIVTGLEGDVNFLDRDWTWESVFYFGQNNSVSSQRALDQVRLGLALDSVIDTRVGSATQGQIVCRASITPPPDPRNGNVSSTNRSDVANCQPFNPFGYGNFDEATRNYLIHETFQAAQIQQAAVELNAAGELADLPGGAWSVAGGFTHRRERAIFRVDAFNSTDHPGLINQAPSGNRGGFNTTEVYAETLMPIFGDDFTPLPILSRLWLEGAIRFVDNSVAGSDITWTAGGRTNLSLPFFGDDFLQVRGNFTQSIRAPSVLELFLPQSGGATFANDPCDPRFIVGGPNPARRSANCQAEAANFPGLNLATFQSFIVNSSKATIVGGNPDLENEVAKSWTVGGVIRPGFIQGLEMSIDWTNIRLTDAILAITGTQLMNACYDSPDFPNNNFCAAITRDGTFQPVLLRLPFGNAAERTFAGLIAAVNWNFPAADVPFLGAAPGNFTLNGQFFHTHRHDQRLASGDFDQFAGENATTGFSGGERGFEKFRYQLNASYNTDRWNLLWQLNSETPTFFNLEGSLENRAPEDRTSGRHYRSHNFALRYNLTDSLSGRFVINNVFDNKDTAQESAFAVGNNLQYRDPVGRRFIFGINAAL